MDGDHETGRERAAAVARYDGIRLVEDSLDIETCEGAATIGLELVDTSPSFDAVLIALGGGAPATGVGHVVKALAPEVEVICVQPLGAPAMTHSWHQRRVVTTDSTATIADGVAGPAPHHRWVGAAPTPQVLTVAHALHARTSSKEAGGGRPNIGSAPYTFETDAGTFRSQQSQWSPRRRPSSPRLLPGKDRSGPVSARPEKASWA